MVENLDLSEELGLVKKLGLVDVVEKLDISEKLGLVGMLEKLDLDEKMDFEGKVVASFCSGCRLPSVIGIFVFVFSIIFVGEDLHR